MCSFFVDSSGLTAHGQDGFLLQLSLLNAWHKVFKKAYLGQTYILCLWFKSQLGWLPAAICTSAFVLKKCVLLSTEFIESVLNPDPEQNTVSSTEEKQEVSNAPTP